MAKKYKKSEPLNRWVALVLAIPTLFVATLFCSLIFTSKPIAREDATKLTCVYEDFKGGKKLLKGGYNEIILIFKDGSRQYIDVSCITYELCEKVENFAQGTEIELLVNPNNNYVIELIANDEILLEFDYAQKALERESIGFLYLGIFMYASGIAFIVQAALDFKKKIKRAKFLKANNSKK